MCVLRAERGLGGWYVAGWQAPLDTAAAARLLADVLVPDERQRWLALDRLVAALWAEVGPQHSRPATVSKEIPTEPWQLESNGLAAEICTSIWQRHIMLQLAAHICATASAQASRPVPQTKPPPLPDR